MKGYFVVLLAMSALALSGCGSPSPAPSNPAPNQESSGKLPVSNPNPTEGSPKPPERKKPETEQENAPPSPAPSNPAPNQESSGKLPVSNPNPAEGSPRPPEKKRPQTEQEKAPPMKMCSEIYEKGQELGRGAQGIVYDVVKPCFSKDCSNSIVKESTDLSISHGNRLSVLAAQLGVAPPIFQSGNCMKDGRTLAYKIEKKLFPATIAFVESHASEFGKQVLKMVKTLHSNDLTHGDIHLGNILYDAPVNPKFYLTDYDKGLELNKLSSDEKQGHIAFEDLAARDMIGGNYYPPGGWPKDVEEHVAGAGGLKVWQTQIFKWKKADIDLDGEISPIEERALSDRLGSATIAHIASEMYNRRVKDLTRNERSGFLADMNLDGILTDQEHNNDSVKSDYEAYTKDLKKKSNDYQIKGSDRVIDLKGPYAQEPLLAKHILLISGGDINDKRRFPRLTAEHYQKFAKNKGYRFETFAGNLASPRVPYWSKIFMLFDKLERPENRVVVWLDDDGIVDPKSNMIERYLLEISVDKDLIVAMDPEKYAFLNTGAVIVRNTKNAKDLLLEMIRVGEEPRIFDGFTRSLMTWRQDTACLHEQQALQELVLKIKIGITWESQTPRKTRRDWTSMVEVVPQLDKASGRNMNFFTNGIMGQILIGRYDPDSNNKIEYLSYKPPFFVQCAGPHVDKNNCVGDIIRWVNREIEWWQ